MDFAKPYILVSSENYGFFFPPLWISDSPLKLKIIKEIGKH